MPGFALTSTCLISKAALGTVPFLVNPKVVPYRGGLCDHPRFTDLRRRMVLEWQPGVGIFTKLDILSLLFYILESISVN